MGAGAQVVAGGVEGHPTPRGVDAGVVAERLGRAVDHDGARLGQTLGDLAARLQPLGQIAETAGSWFGLRPLAALRSGGGNPWATVAG